MHLLVRHFLYYSNLAILEQLLKIPIASFFLVNPLPNYKKHTILTKKANNLKSPKKAASGPFGGARYGPFKAGYTMI